MDVLSTVHLPTCMHAQLTTGFAAVTLNVENAMAVTSIQLGQVWRKDENGKDYLVTKVYSEVFTQYAVLRPAEVTAQDAPTTRVKVAKTGAGAALTGITGTQTGSV